MGTQGTGRKRNPNKEKSTAEDDALNLIAREAEARLAAKRAARAEAREIRMKELERQQKEISDDDERMSVGSRGSVRVEDRDYIEKGSRAASALTAATLTSVGGTSSRRGSGETAITLDAETSIREIKDALVEVEEKYRKAMVSNAQLDNEKNNLMYQVDTLKDSLMELEELLTESRREYDEKAKDFEREKHAHSVLQFQFNEMKETLKQSEELLNDIRQLRMKQDGFVREISDLQETVEWKDKKIGALERQKEYTDAIRIERDELRDEVVKLKDILKKHGIVLGLDLNINGEVDEAGTGDPSSGEPAPRPTQDSQTSPTEGNSMLGGAQENQMGSSGDEEMDPEQHQQTLEGAKESHPSSPTPCSFAGASAPETSREEQASLPAVGDSVGESSGPGMDHDTDTPVVDVKNITPFSSEVQITVTAPEENGTGGGGGDGMGMEMIEWGGLGESGAEEVRVDGSEAIVSKGSDDITDTSPNKEVRVDGAETIVRRSSTDISDTSLSELSKEQGSRLEDTERSELNLSSTVSCPQPLVGETVENTIEGSLAGDTAPVTSITEPQHEKEDVESEKVAELPSGVISNKSQPQVASATGKKKKKKKKGKKKKGGNQEDEKRDEAKERNATEAVKAATEKDLGLAVRGNGPAMEPEIASSPVETLNESPVDQAKDEQEKVRQNMLGTERVEEVTSVLGPSTESNLSTTDPINYSKSTNSSDDHNAESTSNVDSSKDGTESSTKTKDLPVESEITDSSKNEPLSINQTKLECPADNRENVDDELQNSSNVVVARDKSEPTVTSESLDDKMGGPSNTDSSIDGVETSPGSEFPLESPCPIDMSSDSAEDTVINGSVEHPLEGTTAVKDEEEPRVETEQKHMSCSVTAADHGSNHAELSSEGTGEEKLNEGLKEPESSLQPDNTLVTISTDTENGDNASLDESFNTPVAENCYSEMAVESELWSDVFSLPVEGPALNTPESANQKDSSNTEVSLEMEQIDTTGILQICPVSSCPAVESHALNTQESVEKKDSSNAEVCLEIEQSDTTGILQMPDSVTEVAEASYFIGEDHSDAGSANVEGGEYLSSVEGFEGNTSPCPVGKEQHESSNDKLEDNSTSQTIKETHQDSDDEEDEYEEGRSFDFDEMDMEAAMMDASDSHQEEEAEDVVESMSKDDDDGNLELCQCHVIESNEDMETHLTQEEPVESYEEMCTVEASMTDTLDEGLGSMSQEDQSPMDKEEATAAKEGESEECNEGEKDVIDEASEVDTLDENIGSGSRDHKNMTDKEGATATRGNGQIEEQVITVKKEITGKPILEAGERGTIGEPGIVGSEGAEFLLSSGEEVKEAVEIGPQARALGSQKKQDQVGGKTEPSRKDSRKNSKKGKGKGKEECKMS